MKRMIIFVTVMLLFVGGVLSFTSQVYGQSAKKVLMLLRDGQSYDLDLMLKMEVPTMTNLLKRAGFQVDVASSSAQPIVGIEKIMNLSEVKLDDYMGMIIPCLNILKGTTTPETVAVIKKVLADGKPVAAAMSSVPILAEAGLLKGKKYAQPSDPLQTTATRKSPDLRFADAIYSGPGVVQDGKIITSGGCPASEKYLAVQNRTFELTKTFITAIGP